MDGFMNYDFCVSTIVLVCLVPGSKGYIKHQNRPSHGLALNTGGEKTYSFSDGRVFSVKTNDIIYLPKNSTYSVSSEIPGDCYAINFDISGNMDFAPFVINIKQHNEIIRCFQSAKINWEYKRNGYITKCKAELYNIIYTIQREYFSEYIPKSKLEIIMPAVKYIHSEYASGDLKIDKLANLCNISCEYFRKIFKSFYGVSPVSYINNLKITRAKELLESQLYSVNSVAQMSGFNEISYFSREFKKNTGFSPFEYKKSSHK